jgi:3-oxoacyl-[acyl-carrier-protein] synthase II
MSSSRRVVVTGLGIVSPVGNSVESAWSAVVAGKSGVTPIQHFDADTFPCKIYAGISDFDSCLRNSDVIEKKYQRRIGEFIQYGAYASSMAWHDAGLADHAINPQRIGVVIGSGIGGIGMISDTSLVLDKSGPRRVQPFFIPGSIINMASGYVSQKFNCQGPNVSMVSACASGAHSIGFAARSIAYGDADVMLSGAAEHASCALSIAGFCSLKALSSGYNDTPAKASRPWDKNRDGFVLGDGSGVLVLEEYEHARQRGAQIYAEVSGFGMSSDAFHFTQPEPEGRGMCLAMQNALDDASLSPEDIDYVNAHGTSTPMGDMIEYGAVARLIHSRRQDLIMSSTKSMTGHLLGAAGAIEAVFSIMAIKENIAPPTINLDNPEEDCSINLVPHEAQQHVINKVMSNSFGFGGTNVSLIFSSI